MPLKEQYENWEVEFTRDGARAHREFLCRWEEAQMLAPKPGEPHPWWPQLTVSNVRFEGFGKPTMTVFGARFEMLRLLVDYSLEYRRPNLDDPPRITWEYASETLSVAAGRTWDDISKPIDYEELADAVVFPMRTLNIDLTVRTVPQAAIDSLVGKINDAQWTITGSDGQTLVDAAAETLLFQGAEQTGVWDFTDEHWYWRLCYRFLWRPRSHNELWRPPRRVWDAEAEDWARNEDGTYQYVDGPEGQGAWTTTTPKLYETGDFAALLEAPDEETTDL